LPRLSAACFGALAPPHIIWTFCLLWCGYFPLHQPSEKKAPQAVGCAGAHAAFYILAFAGPILLCLPEWNLIFEM
jgi:hypothetical protein